MIMMNMSNKKVLVQVLAAFVAIAIVNPTPIISAVTAITHYEKPPCQADEQAVRIQNVDGTFCSPKCGTTSCPTDVPVGVTAAPQCVLNNPQGGHNCAIICDPSDNGLPCGKKMQCAPIPNTNGLGICDYVVSTNDDNNINNDQAALLRGASTTSNAVVVNEMTIDLSGFDDVVAIGVTES